MMLEDVPPDIVQKLARQLSKEIGHYNEEDWYRGNRVDQAYWRRLAKIRLMYTIRRGNYEALIKRL